MQEIKATLLCGIASVYQKYYFNFTYRAAAHKIEFWSKFTSKFQEHVSRIYTWKKNVPAGRGFSFGIRSESVVSSEEMPGKR